MCAFLTAGIQSDEEAEEKTRRRRRRRDREIPFLFTAVTSQRSSGGISAMYASLGRRLHEAKDAQASVDVIKDLRQKLRDRVPSLDQVKVLFPEIIYTDTVTRQKKLIKYILTVLDQATVPPIVVDYDQMTIEHLAPQSLIGKGDFVDAIIGQLGNLLLVSDDLNSRLKDKPFKAKKEILLKSGFKLPDEITAASTWGPTRIRQRTLALAERAYNDAWRL